MTDRRRIGTRTEVQRPARTSMGPPPFWARHARLSPGHSTGSWWEQEASQLNQAFWDACRQGKLDDVQRMADAVSPSPGRVFH